jgi:transcriptional regulator with XRE-family HTH domain
MQFQTYLNGGMVLMKTFKELRKSKGLTMGSLAELSGVSAKTVSVYEQEPPARPSRKVVGKLSEALKIKPEELMACIYPAKKGTGVRGNVTTEDNIMLEEMHVNRLVRLIDKELEELRYILLESVELTDDYPSIGKCMDMVAFDIELLSEIKGRFLE